MGKEKRNKNDNSDNEPMNIIKLNELNVGPGGDSTSSNHGDYYFDSIKEEVSVIYEKYSPFVKIKNKTVFVVAGKPGLARLCEGGIVSIVDKTFFESHDDESYVVCYEPRIITAIIMHDWFMEQTDIDEEEINRIINPLLFETEAIDFLKRIDCYHSERIWKIYSDPEHRAPITKFIPKEIQKRVERVLKARNK